MMRALTFRLAGVPLEIRTPSRRLQDLFAGYFAAYAPQLRQEDEAQPRWVDEEAQGWRLGGGEGESPGSGAGQIDLLRVDRLPELADLLPGGARQIAQTGILSLWQGSSTTNEEWVFLSEGAVFRVDGAAGKMTGWIAPAALALPHILVNTTTLLPLLLLLRQKGRYHLHAAAVESPKGERWLICGPPRAGKSTLTTALGLSGWQPIADDGLFLSVCHGAPYLEAFRKPFHLDRQLWERWPMLAEVRQGPVSLERILVDGLSHFGTAELAQSGWSGIDAILLPRISGMRQSALASIEPSRVLLTLAQESVYFPLCPPHPQRQWSLLTELVRQARGYTLSAGEDLLDHPGRIAHLLDG